MEQEAVRKDHAFSTAISEQVNSTVQRIEYPIEIIHPKLPTPSRLNLGPLTTPILEVTSTILNILRQLLRPQARTRNLTQLTTA
jgi:hypothetical protein